MLKNMHNEIRTCGVSSFERIYEVVKQIPEGKADVQTSMLLKEGVKFKDGHVIMENYQWDTSWLELGR